MRSKLGKKLLACAITTSLLLSMAGCDAADAEDVWTGPKNQTISDDSKWVNSSIDGLIDENLQTSPKDDYYNYVNKEWTLNTKVDEDYMETSFFVDCGKLVKERKISIVSGTQDPQAFTTADIGIDQADLEHDQQLVQQFTSIAADWDKRNALGYQPIIPYIEKIKNISSLEEMADFIADVDGANLTGRTFFTCSIDEYALVSTEKYSAILQPVTEFNLSDMFSYLNMDGDALVDKYFMERMAKRAFEQLGYSEQEAEDIIQDAYAIECLLTDKMNQNNETLGYYRSVGEGAYTMDELQEMAGAYPLKAYLTKIGFDKAEHIYTAEPAYVKQVGRVFKEGNLEKIKSYYMLATVLFSMKFVDRESFELLQEREALAANKFDDKEDTEGKGDTAKEEEIRDEWDLILKTYVSEYLAGPLDIVYVARYCNRTQKEDLTNLINELVSYYEKMIDEETWLSEEARAATKEKLEAIKINVLYPDHFDSYQGIQFAPDDTLVQMIQKIRVGNLRQAAANIDQPMDHSKWDLTSSPTTTINAQYIPSQNSINIFAGIISNGFVYNENMSKEEKLARIGVIAGHEISHAFDTNGSQYDKDGNEKVWWNKDDQTAFGTRTMALVKYLDTLKPYPGAFMTSGATIVGEVIADMGGMKATLEIAKSIDGFNYELYFTSFASMWAKKASYLSIVLSASTDVHPMSFIRVNTSVNQFEEFYQLYNVQEGDGMYLAPEERIAVW